MFSFCPRSHRSSRGAHVTGVAVNWCGSELLATYNPSGEVYRFDIKKNAVGTSSSNSPRWRCGDAGILGRAGGGGEGKGGGGVFTFLVRSVAPRSWDFTLVLCVKFSLCLSLCLSRFGNFRCTVEYPVVCFVPFLLAGKATRSRSRTRIRVRTRTITRTCKRD